MKDRGAKTMALMPLRPAAAEARIQLERPVTSMRTETPRARAMTSTTPIMSPAPAMKVSTSSRSDRPATTPMMMAMMRNQAVASAKYHWPSGVPVRKADQPRDVVVSLVTTASGSELNTMSPSMPPSPQAATISSPVMGAVTSSEA